MAKKQKKEEHIPKPEKDVKREKSQGSFKMGLADFVKKTSTEPKKKSK